MDTPISAGDRGSLVDALLDADLGLLEKLRSLGYWASGCGGSGFRILGLGGFRL